MKRIRKHFAAPTWSPSTLSSAPFALRARFPLVLAIIVMALLGASVAVAEHHAISPRTGTYKGPSENTLGEDYPVFATVSRKGSQTSISLETDAPLKCGNGGNYVADLTVLARTGTEKVSAAGTTKDFQGSYRYKLIGKFTKSTFFTGTLSATGRLDVGEPHTTKCITGPITFKLFHYR